MSSAHRTNPGPEPAINQRTKEFRCGFGDSVGQRADCGDRLSRRCRRHRFRCPVIEDPSVPVLKHPPGLAKSRLAPRLQQCWASSRETGHDLRKMREWIKWRVTALEKRRRVAGRPRRIPARRSANRRAFLLPSLSSNETPRILTNNQGECKHTICSGQFFLTTTCRDEKSACVAFLDGLVP